LIDKVTQELARLTYRAEYGVAVTVENMQYYAAEDVATAGNGGKLSVADISDVDVNLWTPGIPKATFAGVPMDGRRFYAYIKISTRAGTYYIEVELEVVPANISIRA
jgi:hypothetical protein